MSTNKFVNSVLAVSFKPRSWTKKTNCIELYRVDFNQSGVVAFSL